MTVNSIHRQGRKGRKGKAKSRKAREFVRDVELLGDKGLFLRFPGVLRVPLKGVLKGILGGEGFF
jgi:hypothetical protein